MKYLSEVKLENKRVLLRCDFNVPISDGIILDDSKIKKSLKTIQYLLDNNNQVIILSHFGRVKTEEDKQKNSLLPVFHQLKRYIDIHFASDPQNVNEELLKNSKCILLENTRFTDIPSKKESSNDLELASYWASLADCFVLDAFGSMHRVHSSTAGVSKYLTTYLGFLVEEEFKYLNDLITKPEHPFVVIMGGAKATDKIGVIRSLLTKCDYLVLTGGILNSFLKVKGINVGKSLKNEDEKINEEIKEIINSYSDKLIFSKEVIVNNNGEVLTKDALTLTDFDIIYDNILNINSILMKAKTIFVNGTCGKYEMSEYNKGTKKLLEDLSQVDAKVIVGGGDTASATKTFGYTNKFYYVSSGGGATLEYLAFGNLKAIDYIKENELDIN